MRSQQKSREGSWALKKIIHGPLENILRARIESCRSGRIVNISSALPCVPSPSLSRPGLQEPSSRARQEGEAEPSAGSDSFRAGSARGVSFSLLSLWLGEAGRRRIQFEARHVPAAVGSGADGINLEEGVPLTANGVCQALAGGITVGRGRERKKEGRTGHGQQSSRVPHCPRHKHKLAAAGHCGASSCSFHRYSPQNFTCPEDKHSV